MNHSLKEFASKLDQIEQDFLKDYFTFLKFQSISTQPQYKPEIEKCATWLEKKLKELSFKTELWPTKGHPVLYGENLEAGPQKPTLLFYQHYDVQPVDPLSLWTSPPFEPRRDGDLIYARGASDNKGQAFFVLLALKLIFEKTGKYPLNIKFLIEGEEEIGSKSLTKILPNYQKQLKSDYLTIVDVDIPKEDVPAVNLACRGMLPYTIELTGSNTDLHSGIHGGLVYNPLRALVEVLSACYDASGRVTIPGFYKGVKDYTEKEKKELYLEFDEKEYEEKYEAKPNGGEKDYTPLERTGMRPTFEINGIWGGYNEEGFKTVIPAKAFAKVSMRLVYEQDPAAISENFERFLKSHLPEGMKLNLQLEGEPAKALTCPLNSKIVQAASKAYQDVFNRPCQKIMGGGSLPIAALLDKASGAELLLFGLGLSSDKIHAPNEHFSVSRIKRGALVIARFIEELSQL